MTAGPRLILRRAAMGGLIAGAVMVYLAVVGVAGAFATRPIVAAIGGEGPGLITLGRVMLVAAPFIISLLVAGRVRATAGGRSAVLAVASASLVGLVGGAVLGGFILLAASVDMTGVFLPVTPALVDVLSFGQDAVAGALLVIVMSTTVGAVAGLLQLLQSRDRRTALTALGATLLLALLERILGPVLGQLDLDEVQDFVFEEGGLSLPAAALTFGLVAAASWAWNRPAVPVRARMQGMPPDSARRLGLIAAAAGVAALLALPLVSTGFVSLVLVNVAFYLVLALGLNIVVGYAGLLDLGYVAFYAVGAYSMGILISPSSTLGGPFSSILGVEWAFWLALPVVMIVTALVGVLIGAPVLRLRGDYLAIVTLGFGEIARVLVGSDALRPWLGGPGGVVGLPNLYVPFVGLELTSPGAYYYPVVAFAGFAAFVAWRLSRSRTGRAWNAMREDETVAAATGINTTNYKLLAFALGGTLGGLAGALFAVQLRTVFPGSFLLIVSITVLAIIIVGGMGTIRGVIVGALILVGLPDALREFGEYRFLVYGAALVAMMILRPEGLFPSRVRRAELHEDVEVEGRPQLPASEATT